MGIIKAAINAVGGTLSDSYLEAYRPAKMGPRTVVAPGVFADSGQGRNTNTKRSNNVISNGSIIQVASGQLMCLVDGGRVVDYSTVPGYYKVENSSSPSLFNGDFGASLQDGWDRIRFGGNTYHEQRVIYINLRAMEGIKFGTKSPVPYYDEHYKIDVMVRAFGTFSIQVVEPWKFFNAVIPPECITDGKGLEVDEYDNAVDEILTFISDRNKTKDVLNWIHSINKEFSKLLEYIHLQLLFYVLQKNIQLHLLFFDMRSITIRVCVRPSFRPPLQEVSKTQVLIRTAQRQLSWALAWAWAQQATLWAALPIPICSRCRCSSSISSRIRSSLTVSSLTVSNHSSSMVSSRSSPMVSPGSKHLSRQHLSSKHLSSKHLSSKHLSSKHPSSKLLSRQRQDGLVKTADRQAIPVISARSAIHRSPCSDRLIP